MAFDYRWTEGGLVGASVTILVVYHWWLWHRNRRTPRSTAMGRHQLARSAWIAMVHDGSRDILVVQTLRNFITSATFLASTSVLFAFGLLGAAFTSDKLSKFSHGLNYLGNQDAELWLFKALILFVNFMAVFFNFSLAIRAFTHSGFAINLPDELAAQVGDRIGNSELQRGALHFTLGMRGYYLAIPMALWFFGPAWMFLGTLLLVLILWRVD
jgi:uncharacterized membrane protein